MVNNAHTSPIDNDARKNEYTYKSPVNKELVKSISLGDINSEEYYSKPLSIPEDLINSLSEQDSNHSNQQVVVNRSPEIKKREIIDLYDLAISNYPKDMEIFMVLSEEFLFRYSSKEFLPILGMEKICYMVLWQAIYFIEKYEGDEDGKIGKKYLLKLKHAINYIADNIDHMSGDRDFSCVFLQLKTHYLLITGQFDVAYEGINNNLQNLYEFNLSTEERELLLADYKITALYERGEYDEALELYNLTFKAFADYILDYPESTKLFIKWQKDILLAKGSKLFADKKYKEAEGVFAELLKKDPDNITAKEKLHKMINDLAIRDQDGKISLDNAILIGDIRFDLKEYTMSLQSFDNAIKMYPNDTLEARRYYSYVLKFFSLENLDTEIPLQDFLSIGNKLYILKDYRQAEKICASILEKHPDNQQAEKILSDILIELTSPGAKKNNHLLIGNIRADLEKTTRTVSQ